MTEINTVSIKFKPGTYSVFRNLQNKVWYAIGEYVDNAVQSYEDNKSELRKMHKGKYQFEIRINIDRENDLMTICDNAAGISRRNFTRAFEPANVPIDATGLHEFGMGMKTASIWLADFWSVKTKALNESIERYVEFDLHEVLAEEQEVLEVKSSRKKTDDHYTEIYLKNLSKNAPTAFQMTKLKNHLASIYRKYIRTEELHLIINDCKLEYKDPDILVAPPAGNLSGKEILWKKEIDFKVGKRRVTGFVGLLSKMSTDEHNGLSLFRRGRVIEGSHDEKYRPKVLCGQVGSFRYKSLFGELELEGFDVSFNKGAFQDLEHVEEVLESIRTELTQKNFNLFKQADDYRRPKKKEDAGSVAKSIVKSLQKEKKASSLGAKVAASIKEISNESLAEKNDKRIKAANPIDSHEDGFTIGETEYILKLDVINEKSVPDLYSLFLDSGGRNVKKITYKINLSHPLFNRFDQFKKEDDYKPIFLIIRSLVLAEIHSQGQGTKNAGNVRMNFNSFLRKA